nr:family peptidase [Candidatus Cloacimonadota bacterium]
MEITAPGGDLEKTKYAILYGADGVYCGYKQFGLRAAAGNLNKDELQEAISFAHSHGSRLYLTLNAYLRNEDFAQLPDFIHWLDGTDIDAVIVSDPGIFSTVREHSSIPIHISTQANITSLYAAKFWYELGAKRIVPARELSFKEILAIKEALPDLEIECFIHGAMCVAYSGRCLLSAYLNKRSANSGACTQPCRWNWALTEEQRPGQYFPVDEDQYGSYILSSKDLCLLDKMPEMVSSGIHAGKIEGRMKSIYYVAQITRIYKAAKQADPSDTKLWAKLNKELLMVSHRPYWQGFYDFDHSSAGIVEASQSPAYTSESQYCGKVIAHQEGMLYFDAFHKINVGDTIQVIFPDMANDFSLKLDKIFDDDKQEVTQTKPNYRYAIETHNMANMNYEGALIRTCQNS